MIKKILTVGAIVLLSACAEMQTSEQQMETKPVAAAMSSSATEAKVAIAAAEKARKAAGAVGYEWRHTAKQINDAKAAAKKEDYKTAIALAKKAEREGIDALAQYHEQKNAGKMN
ncbi:MAG: hypothetical protein OQK78_09590 [Gammaproteobacteria bacterium]|nr:hypothetical protein [Gammaproteobacteria bacterium]MCW8888999.1 hypothetical protein [Gammaproteobacteria bacterium]